MVFSGVTGLVVINKDGDRKPDYSMEILNNDEWISMYDYIAATETLEVVQNDGFTWPGGKPQNEEPKDAPACGWENELCPDNTREFKKVHMVYMQLPLR